MIRYKAEITSIHHLHLYSLYHLHRHLFLHLGESLAQRCVWVDLEICRLLLLLEEGVVAARGRAAHSEVTVLDQRVGIDGVVEVVGRVPLLHGGRGVIYCVLVVALIGKANCSADVGGKFTLLVHKEVVRVS